MSDRREFIKKSVLLGATTMMAPVSGLFGEEMNRDRIVGESVGVRRAASKGDTYTVNMGYVRAAQRSPRQIVVPDVNGYKVLKGDFHIHTLFSDGAVMPVDRMVEAVDNGLDAIAITDHFEYRPFFSAVGKWKLVDATADNFNLWYEIAREEAEKRNLLLVRGAEVTKSTMPPGHLNVLFTTDNNPVYAAVNDWRKMLQTAHDQGALILWNHPGWEAPKSGGIEKGAPLVFHKEHEEIVKKGMLQGIEIFNHTEHYPIVSDWCNDYDLAPFANSDIHASELSLYGIQNPLRPINLVFAKERTVESLREAMFAKRMVAMAADTLWGRDSLLTALFNSSVEIKTVTPGTLSLRNKSSLPVSVTLGGVVFDLPKDVERQVYKAENAKSLTVVNWMVGMNKALEVTLK
ncbi:MAG: PHP domain-containing protein [Dysgonamonadaceae bacterium]|nr:PHP domain-containing protein [Dysgonamonadaceae bacterium]